MHQHVRSLHSSCHKTWLFSFFWVPLTFSLDWGRWHKQKVTNGEEKSDRYENGHSDRQRHKQEHRLADLLMNWVTCHPTTWPTNNTFSIFKCQRNVPRNERTQSHWQLTHCFQKHKIWQRIFTCYFGGDAGSDGRAKALVRGCFEGEEVGCPWVETYEQVMGLIPEPEHPSPLGCKISAGVQWAQGLVGNLQSDRRHTFIHFSFTLFDVI